MKFSCAAVLALGSLVGKGDGFVLAPSVTSRSESGKLIVKNGSAAITSAPVRTTTATEMVGGMPADDDFLDALRPGKKRGNNDDDEDEVDVGSESSRFKDLMKAAKMAGGQQHIPRPIENPFLNPPPPSVAAGGDPSGLSVEEQARLFREMMAQTQQQQQQQQQLGAILPPPAPRVAKTDRAGRPVGRNRDADSIANTADLYFAQLKRDSTVRTMARLRGDDDVADQVFADEGIKQLDDLLQKNPYLQGQREDEMRQIEAIPQDVLSQYFESSAVRDEDLTKSGVSYKEKLMQRRQKENKEQSTTNMASPAPLAAPVPEPEVVVEQKLTVDVDLPSPVQPEPVVTAQSQVTIEQQVAVVAPSPPQLEPVVANTPSAPHVVVTNAVGAMASANPEEVRQKIRTLMGLILKHRGGPGFGKGRLKGPDIDRFEGLLQEITALLREEGKLSQPVNSPLISTVAPAIASDSAVVQPTPVAPPSSSAGTPSVIGSIDSTIACIEGAITMYKNSPPQLQPSVLGVLQAALVSAVDTCNSVLAAQPPPPIVPGSPDGQIDSMIACIEGAVTMYKNSPPQLRESVLVALRAALMSAVETCKTIVSGGAVPQQTATIHSPVATTPPPVTIMPLTPATAASTVVSAPSPTVAGMDPNSKALEEIYESVKAAHGKGSLGLKGDLTQAEATKLADQLVEMRKLLMQELEAGIPDPEPLDTPTGVSADSSASRYQAMLAKARAEKAAA